MNKNLSIETLDLTRLFKGKKKRREKKPDRNVLALEEVNLKVDKGELFGILGPNGAGKTTLIKILTTLLLPTSGRAFVDGLDVVKDFSTIRSRINTVSGGEHAGYGILTVRETLWMFSQFYNVSYSTAKKRIKELLDIVKLSEEIDTKIHKLSTGMRQKMNFVRGFISDPKIIFLDEPTLGLDVGAARDCRKFMKEWMKREGKTVLLTTHHMPEAEELCQRLAIIDRGRILACDSPKNLKRMVQKESVFLLEVGVHNFESLAQKSLESLKNIPGVKSVSQHERSNHDSTELRIVLEEDSIISKVLEKITHDHTQILTLQKMEPSLEDVFVQLVGKGLEESDEKSVTG
jgi:ABC-2 type transport system ATP-binding protein